MKMLLGKYMIFILLICLAGCATPPQTAAVPDSGIWIKLEANSEMLLKSESKGLAGSIEIKAKDEDGELILWSPGSWTITIKKSEEGAIVTQDFKDHVEPSNGPFIVQASAHSEKISVKWESNTWYVKLAE